MCMGAHTNVCVCANYMYLSPFRQDEMALGELGGAKGEGEGEAEGEGEGGAKGEGEGGAKGGGKEAEGPTKSEGGEEDAGVRRVRLSGVDEPDETKVRVNRCQNILCTWN